MTIPPFGAHPLSDPQDASLPPAADGPAVLADDIDPKTGEFLSLDGVHPVDAHLRYQFQVRAGSGSAVGRVGHRFFEIETIDGQTEQSLRLEAQRIVRLLGPEWVRVQPPDSDTPGIRVEADPTTQLGALVLDYFNVLAGRSDELRRGLES